jgi:hypothetical protein
MLIPEELCAGYASTRQLKRTCGCRRVHYYICVLLYVSSYCYRCVLVLPRMCAHTPHASSLLLHFLILHFCVLVLLHLSSNYYYSSRTYIVGAALGFRV